MFKWFKGLFSRKNKNTKQDDINTEEIDNILEESTEEDSYNDWSVVMLDAGDKKVNAIKAVRYVTGLGLKDAKALVDGVPSCIIEDISADEALEVTRQLMEAGCILSCSNEDDAFLVGSCSTEDSGYEMFGGTPDVVEN